jgi:hypothetical protein
MKNFYFHLIFLLIISFSSKSQNKYHGSFSEKVYLINGIIPDYGKGFLQYKIDLRQKTELVLYANVYGVNSELVYKHVITLPHDMIFLGHTRNEGMSVLLFHDRDRKTLVNVVFFNAGKTYRLLQKDFRKPLLYPQIIYFDSQAFYTQNKTQGEWLLTKLTYQLDTIWSKSMQKVELNNSLRSVKKEKKRLYLNIEGNKIICVDDSTGKTIYASNLPTNNLEVSQIVTTDNEIVIGGEEFYVSGKKRLFKNLFLWVIDSVGTIKSKRDFPIASLGQSLPKSENNFTFLRDLIKVNGSYRLIAETVTESTGEGEISGNVYGIFASAKWGVGVNLPRNYIKSAQLAILSEVEGPENSIQVLQKDPMQKYYLGDMDVLGFANDRYLTYQNTFDYQLQLKNQKGSAQFIYLKTFTESGLKLAKVDLTAQTITEYFLSENIEKLMSYRLYQINETKLIVELLTRSERKFHTVDLENLK